MNTHAFDAVWSVYKAIKDHVAAGGDLSSFEHKNDIGRGIANELFGKLLDLDFYGTSVCCCLRNVYFQNYFFYYAMPRLSPRETSHSTLKATRSWCTKSCRCAVESSS